MLGSELGRGAFSHVAPIDRAADFVLRLHFVSSARAEEAIGIRDETILGLRRKPDETLTAYHEAAGIGATAQIRHRLQRIIDEISEPKCIVD
ncbi:hypothetical protein ACQR0Z_19585 [Bradyrhizobium sp. HKCCYLS3077]|uniref:hypothetical protein n=1 Tax=Bradyrhizobium sp. HKCCYLS3077 TaxID=3420761 RepID=UPI003EB7A965